MSAGSEQALDQLCRRYWRPVYVYVRATGVLPHEAEDATQEFFADMLRRDWLKRADPDRGRFEQLQSFLTRTPSVSEYAQLREALELREAQIAVAVTVFRDASPR